MSYIYLASPYTANSAATRHKRYKAALDVVVKSLREGEIVYSPIVYTKDIAKAMPDLGTEYAKWKQQCEVMIQNCEFMAVLQIPGWKKSVGVQAEIEYATSIGKNIVYFDPTKV